MIEAGWIPGVCDSRETRRIGHATYRADVVWVAFDTPVDDDD